MNPILRFFRLLSLLVALAALLSWHTASFLDTLPKPLRLGTSPGPAAEIAYKVKEIAQQQHLEIDVRVYGDYLKLNEALANGELDANAFQPRYYLDAVNRDLGYDFQPLTDTVFAPLGLYGRRGNETTFQPLERETVWISREPRQQSRSLALLRDAGMLQLAEVPLGVLHTLQDVVANPYHLQLSLLNEDALLLASPETGRLMLLPLQAKKKGWQPLPDALLLETPSASFTHVLAVRSTANVKPELAALAKIYASAELRDFILERYHGSWLPANFRP